MIQLTFKSRFFKTCLIHMNLLSSPTRKWVSSVPRERVFSFDDKNWSMAVSNTTADATDAAAKISIFIFEKMHWVKHMWWIKKKLVKSHTDEKCHYIYRFATIDNNFSRCSFSIMSNVSSKKKIIFLKLSISWQSKSLQNWDKKRLKKIIFLITF